MWISPQHRPPSQSPSPHSPSISPPLLNNCFAYGCSATATQTLYGTGRCNGARIHSCTKVGQKLCRAHHVCETPQTFMRQQEKQSVSALPAPCTSMHKPGIADSADFFFGGGRAEELNFLARGATAADFFHWGPRDAWGLSQGFTSLRSGL